MFYLFVSNTPVWVWPLLLGLLVLGLRQTRAQHMGWMRVTVLTLQTYIRTLTRSKLG